MMYLIQDLVDNQLVAKSTFPAILYDRASLISRVNCCCPRKTDVLKHFKLLHNL